MRGMHVISMEKENMGYAKHKQGPPPSLKVNARAPAADLPQFPFLLNEKFVVCKGTRLLHFPPCGLCTFLQMMELQYIHDSFQQEGDSLHWSHGEILCSCLTASPYCSPCVLLVHELSFYSHYCWKLTLCDHNNSVFIM